MGYVSMGIFVLTTGSKSLHDCSTSSACTNRVLSPFMISSRSVSYASGSDSPRSLYWNCRGIFFILFIEPGAFTSIRSENPSSGCSVMSRMLDDTRHSSSIVRKRHTGARLKCTAIRVSFFGSLLPVKRVKGTPCHRQLSI